MAAYMIRFLTRSFGLLTLVLPASVGFAEDYTVPQGMDFNPVPCIEAAHDMNEPYKRFVGDYCSNVLLQLCLSSDNGKACLLDGTNSLRARLEGLKERLPQTAPERDKSAMKQRIAYGVVFDDPEIACAEATGFVQKAAPHVTPETRISKKQACLFGQTAAQLSRGFDLADMLGLDD